MSWATLAAGANSTLASLWRVEAKSTSELMIAFHRHLLEGDAKAVALRKAEFEIMRKPEYHHPYYWASFTLTGNGSSGIFF